MAVEKIIEVERGETIPSGWVFVELLATEDRTFPTTGTNVRSVSVDIILVEKANVIKKSKKKDSDAVRPFAPLIPDLPRPGRPYSPWRDSDYPWPRPPRPVWDYPNRPMYLD